MMRVSAAASMSSGTTSGVQQQARQEGHTHTLIAEALVTRCAGHSMTNTKLCAQVAAAGLAIVRASEECAAVMQGSRHACICTLSVEAAK